MNHRGDEKGNASRAEEFLQIFKKGAEFTQDLLKENERLRFRILQIETGRGGEGSAPESASSREVEGLRQRVRELEEEKEEILGRIKEVEAENFDFANRYVEIETENNMLANLYIASYQLHSSLDPREVLRIISEIVINLVGAEEFSVLLLDEKKGVLRAVAAEGHELDKIPVVPLGEGLVGTVASDGKEFFAEDLEKPGTFDAPLVCIPMKINERVIGVIAIYGLFVQKKEFAPVDFELFTLLAGHAATAIFASRLYSESERKLSTIQGFIDFLNR